MSGPQQVTADAEQVLDHAVDGREALQLAGGLEASRRGPTIAARLDDDVDHVAVFIHGSPQVVQPPADLDEHFVQIPGVAHPASPASQAPRILESERQTPLADRLIRDGDTAFSEEILDISETQAKAVVDPDGVTDDFSRKSVSAIAGGWRVICPLSHLGVNLTMPTRKCSTYALNAVRRAGAWRSCLSVQLTLTPPALPSGPGRHLPAYPARLDLHLG